MAICIIVDKNKTEIFKSREHINEKDGPNRGFGMTL